MRIKRTSYVKKHSENGKWLIAYFNICAYLEYGSVLNWSDLFPYPQHPAMNETYQMFDEAMNDW